MSDYKVGIELLLASNGEALLGVLGRRLLGVHGNVKDLEGGFSRLKLAIGGAFAIGGAMALLGVMKELVSKGAELEDQLYKLQTAGFTGKEIVAVKRNATAVASQFPNLTERELIKLTGETTMVYGDPAVAMKNLPVAAAYLSAIKLRHPEDSAGASATAEDSIFKILRSTEMRGLAQDPAEVQRALTAAYRGQAAFGDENFDPNTAFQTVKYGRLASRYMSDRFMFGPGLVAAQELGGSNYGNSINQIMQAFIGGHITKTALLEAEKIGIIDAKKVKMGPRGSFNLGDAVPGRALLQTDADLWFQKYFAPKVDAASKGDMSARDQILRQLFFRTTGQQVAEMLGWQMGPGGRFSKDVDRLNKAMTPDQAVAGSFTNLATSAQSLNVQIDRLKTNLGDPAAKAAGGVAGKLVAPVRGAANAAANHPKAAAAVDIGIATGIAAGGFFGSRWLLAAAKPLIQRLLGTGATAAAGAAAEGTAGTGIFAGLTEGVTGLAGALGALALVPLGVIATGVGGIAIGFARIWKDAETALGHAMRWKDLFPSAADVRGPAQGPAPAPKKPVPPPPQQPTTIILHHKTSLDGRTLYKGVEKHLIAAVNGGSSQKGGSMFDPGAQLAHPGSAA